MYSRSAASHSLLASAARLSDRDEQLPGQLLDREEEDTENGNRN